MSFKSIIDFEYRLKARKSDRNYLVKRNYIVPPWGNFVILKLQFSISMAVASLNVRLNDI